MRFVERKPDAIELTISLEQAKQIYVALFQRLRDAGPAGIDSFDDDDLLLNLQTFLQQKARAVGVDCTNHAEWEAFVGYSGAGACDALWNSKRCKAD